MNLNPFSYIDKKIAIYTCIYGGYDNPKEYVEQDIECDYLCFTDNCNLRSNTFKIVVYEPLLAIPTVNANTANVSIVNTVLARSDLFLMAPLRDYDICIMIDGNIELNKSNIISNVLKTVPHNNIDLVLSKHPWNNCIYQEAHFSMKIPKYNNTNLTSQITKYSQEGYPSHNGLYWNGIIFYLHPFAENMRHFYDLYTQELLEYHIDKLCRFHPQGQVSLPYTLWKLNMMHRVHIVESHYNSIVKVHSHNCVPNLQTKPVDKLNLIHANMDTMENVELVTASKEKDKDKDKDKDNTEKNTESRSNEIQVYYGHRNYSFKNVTLKAFKAWEHNGLLRIPVGDHKRAHDLKIDPINGVLKEIKITVNGITRYVLSNESLTLTLSLTLADSTLNLPVTELLANTDQPVISTRTQDPADRLKQLQSSLRLIGGSFCQEYPEQLMSATFIQQDAKVLEIGGNIGRNSLIIAKLLSDDRNLVVMECDTKSASILKQNRANNQLSFHIEDSALSKRRLFLNQWTTIPSEVPIPGMTEVKTITYQELMDKYGIDFNTLVLDCEGAFYYILMDFPEIINNIKLIIVENDYTSIDQKNFVDQTIIGKGFRAIYVQPIQRRSRFVCKDCFFQVWRKDSHF
jgi:FkbM family methyltransferase